MPCLMLNPNVRFTAALWVEDTRVGLPLSGRLRGSGAEEAGGRAPRGGCALVWSPADVWEQQSCPFRTREPLMGPLRCEGGSGSRGRRCGNSSARIPAVSLLWDGGNCMGLRRELPGRGIRSLPPTFHAPKPQILWRGLCYRSALRELNRSQCCSSTTGAWGRRSWNRI